MKPKASSQQPAATGCEECVEQHLFSWPLLPRVFLCLCLLFVVGCAQTNVGAGSKLIIPTQPPPANANARPTAPTRPTSQPTVAVNSGLPTIAVKDLPPEARKTLALIAQGGPFPYNRDGVVYQNRERILPKQETGYYHEYTVPTPGASDRGARRIIAGQRGEMYYTADHYQSFAEVIQ